MKCVALAGRHPVYELSAADLVVRDLSQLSFVNLKQLFAAEERVASQVSAAAVPCRAVLRGGGLGRGREQREARWVDTGREARPGGAPVLCCC